MIVGLVIMKKIGSISLFTVPEGFILTQGYVQSNIKRISYVAYIVVFLVVGSFINLFTAVIIVTTAKPSRYRR